MVQMANARGPEQVHANEKATYQKWGIESQTVVPRYFLRDHFRSVS